MLNSTRTHSVPLRLSPIDACVSNSVCLCLTSDIVQVFRQRATSEAMELVSRLLEYTPSLRLSPIDACAHQYFDELRDTSTRLPTGRELPPLFNFTSAGQHDGHVTACSSMVSMFSAQ